MKKKLRLLMKERQKELNTLIEDKEPKKRKTTLRDKKRGN